VIEVVMITLKKKAKARKCNDHRTVSLVAHALNIVERGGKCNWKKV
jgi:hypothetical protein